MKKRILSIGTVILLVLLTSVWAADITGSWIAKMPIGRGTVETIFYFNVDGTRLTGTVCNSQGETAISEGEVKGDEISFVVIRSSGGSEMQVAYKGEVSVNEIKFTREVRGGTEQPQEFIAKREFQRNGDVPVIPTIKPVEPLYK